MLCPEAVLNVRSDKQRFPPHGLYGGDCGRLAESVVNPGANREKRLPILMTHSEELYEGDLFRHVIAGGGGYGDALERDPTRVMRDVIEEKISHDHARAAYGVVLKDGGLHPDIDLEATLTIRHATKSARAGFETVEPEVLSGEV